MSRLVVVPCCIEAPASFIPKAQYALRMLLLPLGIDPRWVSASALEEGGLYYGTAPEHVARAALVLPLRPETISFFEASEQYDVRRTRWVTWQGEAWPVLFDASDAGGDLIASTFFWLSGWQEYTCGQRDQHGRFPYEASLQCRLDVAVRPVVDAYRSMLADELARRRIPIRRRSWRGREWAFCPTHDIDYARKWRPGMIYRESVHYLLQNRRQVGPAARLQRFAHFLQDWLRPGDPCREAFSRMQAEVEAREGRATYFIKAGAHDKRDVAYRLEQPYMRRRIEALQEAGFEIGLHPSYRAHTHRAYLQAERDRLAAVAGTALRSVRQHYLRYDPRVTPHLHQELGFRIDSTLGFATQEGFRHGTCQPFQLFAIEANKPLDVWEMPLVVMESTLFNRRGLDAGGARAATHRVMQACRRFGGVCVMLWHNTLWDEMDYPGWGRHFLETLDAARNEGALVTSLQDAFERWQNAPLQDT